MHTNTLKLIKFQFLRCANAPCTLILLSCISAQGHTKKNLCPAQMYPDTLKYIKFGLV